MPFVYINHERRTPILPLSTGLLVHPQHAFSHQVVNDRSTACPLPAQVIAKHADTHVTQNLGGFNGSNLVIAQLSGDAPDVLLAPDTNYAVAPAQRLQRLDGAADVVLRNVAAVAGAVHAAQGQPLTHLAQANEPAVLASRRAAHLHYADGQLKVEVVDRLAQQLRPDGAPGAASAAAAAREGIDADGGTHARELGAERRV